MVRDMRKKGMRRMIEEETDSPDALAPGPDGEIENLGAKD
jgi:hypothetical protein